MKLPWVGWLLPLLGCMGHFPPCPAAGGPAWRELSTRHFQLTTDIPADDARQTLAQPERLANPGKYSATDLERMKEGNAPIGSEGWPMELHHKVPLNDGGSNSFDNLQMMTATEHRFGPNFRINHPNVGR